MHRKVKIFPGSPKPPVCVSSPKGCLPIFIKVSKLMKYSLEVTNISLCLAQTKTLYSHR